VAWRAGGGWRARSLLRRVAAHVSAAEGVRRGFLSVAVVKAPEMTGLHQRFCGIAAVTDVLTFDLGSDARAGWIEGEIVACADVAWREAGRGAATGAARRSAARAELALYVVHGILHLAGYEDRSRRGFARMHAREDELLSELGLGRVFARPQ
jgi:probable rRNA maturation factor